MNFNPQINFAKYENRFPLVNIKPHKLKSIVNEGYLSNANKNNHIKRHHHYYYFINNPLNTKPISCLTREGIAIVKEKISAYIKKHPEEEFEQVSDYFGTEWTVYRGHYKIIDGMGTVKDRKDGGDPPPPNAHTPAVFTPTMPKELLEESSAKPTFVKPEPLPLKTRGKEPSKYIIC